MTNPDEFYKKIERIMVNELRSSGEMENRTMQHIGKIYNMSLPYPGKSYDDIYGNIERLITGGKKHGEGQNKKTDLEKLQELGRDE